MKIHENHSYLQQITIFHPFSRLFSGPLVTTSAAGSAADGWALGGAVAAAGAQGVSCAAADDDDLLGTNGWLNRG